MIFKDILDVNLDDEIIMFINLIYVKLNLYNFYNFLLNFDKNS